MNFANQRFSAIFVLLLKVFQNFAFPPICFFFTTASTLTYATDDKRQAIVKIPQGRFDVSTLTLAPLITSSSSSSTSCREVFALSRF